MLWLAAVLSLGVPSFVEAAIPIYEITYRSYRAPNGAPMREERVVRIVNGTRLVVQGRVFAGDELREASFLQTDGTMMTYGSGNLPLPLRKEMLEVARFRPSRYEAFMPEDMPALPPANTKLAPGAMGDPIPVGSALQPKPVVAAAPPSPAPAPAAAASPAPAAAAAPAPAPSTKPSTAPSAEPPKEPQKDSKAPDAKAPGPVAADLAECRKAIDGSVIICPDGIYVKMAQSALSQALDKSLRESGPDSSQGEAQTIEEEAAPAPKAKAAPRAAPKAPQKGAGSAH